MKRKEEDEEGVKEGGEEKIDRENETLSTSWILKRMSRIAATEVAKTPKVR